MKTIFVSMLVAVALAVIPTPIKKLVNDNVRITEPVNGDVYIAGRKVVIDAPVKGGGIVLATYRKTAT